MRLRIGGFLVLAFSSTGATEPCAADHHEYTVTRSVEIRTGAPESQFPAVELSTDFGFVFIAEQSTFIPRADYRQNRKKGLGPYDFYWWLRSRQPVDVIDLDQFERPYSHKHSYMMQLVEEGAVYVRDSNSETFLESVHLEWYSCMIGDFGERGGRRLRTKGGKTIYWHPDWIS